MACGRAGSQGYFHEMLELQKNKGKPFIAAEALVDEEAALAMPHLTGETLTAQEMHIPAALLGKARTHIPSSPLPAAVPATPHTPPATAAHCRHGRRRRPGCASGEPRGAFLQAVWIRAVAFLGRPVRG